MDGGRERKEGVKEERKGKAKKGKERERRGKSGMEGKGGQEELGKEYAEKQATGR